MGRRAWGGRSVSRSIAKHGRSPPPWLKKLWFRDDIDPCRDGNRCIGRWTKDESDGEQTCAVRGDGDECSLQVVRGKIALQAGFLLSLINPNSPDDPVKIEKLKKAAESVMQVKL
jgi:hypothetical protein